MRTSEADLHFQTRAAVARALGISTAATSKWGDVVPYVSAQRLEELTGGALRVDRSLYDERMRPRALKTSDAA
jgi:transcriptional repressor of cell division inhibition gene dicB